MSGIDTNGRASAEARAQGGDPEVRELVARAQSGDRAAFGALYLRYADRVYAYLASTLGNSHDAEDLTVQTFVRVMESIGRFEQRSTPFVAWLFRIARNLAMDHFRAQGRYEPAEAPEPDAVHPSAEDQVLARLGGRMLLEELRTLPKPQRQVLGLKFVLSLSNAEAAVALEKTEGAVKALQHRALATLQRRQPVRAL